MAELEGQHQRSQPRQPAASAPEQAAPATVPVTNPVLAAQRTAGNQAVQRRLRSGAMPVRFILGQQQTLGNQAVQRLLRGHPVAAPGATPIAAGATPAVVIQRFKPPGQAGDDDPDSGAGGGPATLPSTGGGGGPATPSSTGGGGGPATTPAAGDDGSGGAGPVPSDGPAGQGGGPPGATPQGGKPPAGPAGQPETPATDARTNDGATPPKNPLGPEEGAGGYVNPNAYENALNPELTELLEQRADPGQKNRLEKLNASADAARLASLQYSYIPGNFNKQLAQSIVPTDAVMEHFRQATTQNAYASGASFGSASGWIAGLQTGVEFMRGVFRLMGDVIGGASSALGALALVMAPLSAIPGLGIVFVPLTAASAAAGELLAIGKAAYDLLDAQIGLIQLVLNIIRARLSDEPADRARIAQLIKKEAGDISGNIVGAAVSLLTINLGNKAFGAMGGKAATEALEAGGKMTAKQYLASLGTYGRMVAEGGYRNMLKAAITAGGLKYAFRWNVKLAKSVVVAAKGSKIAPAFYPTAKLMSARLLAVGDDVSLASWATGVGVGAGGAKGKSEVGNEGAGDDGTPIPYGGSSGPGSNNAVPGAVPQGVTFEKVAYWPSILEKFGDTREWTHNAQERMLDQYGLAKEDAGEKAAAYEKIKGGVSRLGNRIMAGGQAQAAQAVAGQQDAKKQADQADKAEAGQQKVAEKNQQVVTKGSETKAKADAGQTAASQAKNAEKSTWEKVKAWAWENALSPIFSGLARFQKWLNGVIVEYAMKAAGLEGKDLDLAGIERGALGDQESDKKAEADAKATAAQAPVVDAATEQLKAGASDQEKNAIQGMADSQGWIHDLDTREQMLAAEQDVGAQYIAEAAKILAPQQQQEETGGQIDPNYLAPLTDGAAALEAEIKAAPDTWRADCDGQIAALAGRLEATYPGIDTGPGTAVGQRVLGNLLAKAQPEVDAALVRIDAIVKNAGLLLRTHQYPAAHQLMLNLDAEAKQYKLFSASVYKSFDGVLQIVADQYSDAVAAAMIEGEPAATPGSPEPPPEDKGG